MKKVLSFFVVLLLANVGNVFGQLKINNMLSCSSVAVIINAHDGTYTNCGSTHTAPLTIAASSNLTYADVTYINDNTNCGGPGPGWLGNICLSTTGSSWDAVNVVIQGQTYTVVPPGGGCLGGHNVLTPTTLVCGPITIDWYNGFMGEDIIDIY